MTNRRLSMTDNVPVVTKWFVLQNPHSVILLVRYNTIISTTLQHVKYLPCKTSTMKHLAALLLLILAGLQTIAQDSTKIADTSKKFNERLAEVTVTARRPLMIQEVDKTVVDVKSMVTAAGLNTIELLERIPGVTISGNGDISLNGRGGVLLLIDGRTTYMSAQDLNAYLKSIPAGNIDKVELIDNPSAKYDASGNAIINIKLRKNRNAGLTGNINSGFSQGKYFRSNNSINLNYNRKKLNVFNNVGFSTAEEYHIDLFDRKYFDAGNNITSSILLRNTQVSKNQNINIYSGFDYAVTPKTTLGAIFSFNEGKRYLDFDFEGGNYDEAKNLTGYSNGDNFAKDTRNNINVNLNFAHQYNKDGHELSGEFNYLDYQSGSHRIQHNLLYNDSSALVNDEMFQYLVPVNSKIYVFKADYVRPFKNKMKLEAGVKSSLINNDNISNYYALDGGLMVFGPENSNHFRYDENINAAYANLQKGWNRWQLQLGLRVENLQATGNQLGNEVVAKTEFKKTNTEWFPSAFVLYKVDSMGKNSLSLLTVRRINRPNYFQLNPFQFVRDEYTYAAGNPDLNPQFQYRVEAKFQHKQLYWFGLSYNKFTQVIFNTTEVVGERYILRPNNLGKGFMILLNSGLNVNPAKWWNVNYVLRISRMGLRANLYDEVVNPDAFVVRFEMMNFFPISKTVNAELSGYCASKDLNGQAFTKMMWRMNAGVQKKIFKEKGSIRLGMDDIFHMWTYRNYSFGLKQSYFTQTTEADTQRFNLSFSYRFGKDSNSRKRNRGNANEEEKGRLE